MDDLTAPVSAAATWLGSVVFYGRAPGGRWVSMWGIRAPPAVLRRAPRVGFGQGCYSKCQDRCARPLSRARELLSSRVTSRCSGRWRAFELYAGRNIRRIWTLNMRSRRHKYNITGWRPYHNYGGWARMRLWMTVKRVKWMRGGDWMQQQQR